MNGSRLLRGMGVFYATYFLISGYVGASLVMIVLANLGALLFEHWCEFLYRRGKRKAKP